MRSGQSNSWAFIFAVVILGPRTQAQQPARSPSPQDQAIAILRAINTAQTEYFRTHGIGYSSTLAALSVPVDGANPTRLAAEMVNASLGSSTKGGYIFTYKPGPPNLRGHIVNYSATARPVKWHKGAKSFYTDDTDVVRWTREKRAATPEDPEIDN